MRSAKELKGLAIVDVKNGAKLGTADEVVVSPDDGRLLGFVMKGGLFGGSERIVETSDIRAIGADAITVEGEELAHTAEAAAEAFSQARASDRALIGRKVVTQDGSLLGVVSDYHLDDAVRRVAALTIGGGMMGNGDAIPADRVVSVGPDVIVVSAAGSGGTDGPHPFTA